MRALPAAGAATLAVLLAGCAGLPEHTPIRTGRSVDTVVRDPIRVDLQGPVPGADAEDTVRGFLRASIAFDEDASVARQFLTTTAAEQWAPEGVVIYENGVEPRITVAGTTATVTAPVTGALDRDGHYRDLPAGSSSTLRLTLARAEGQWRLAGGLERFGAMMSRGDFARYASFAIAYSAPGDDALVEDRRWFLQGPGLATRLVRALLEPPPSYLQGAVRTGVPEYTELVGAVAVTDGIASVELSERATSADERARRLLYAQVAHTLGQVRGVDAVQIEVGDARLAVDALPDRPVTPADVPLAAARLRSDVAVARVGTELTAVSAQELGPESLRRDPSTPAVALPRLSAGWHQVALAADATEIAAVSGDDEQLRRWRAAKPIEVPRFAAALTRPTYDRHGILWVAGRADGVTRLYALDTAAAGTRAVAPTTLDVPWLVGRRVRSLQVAADGQRLAVVSEDARGGGTRLDLAGVLRTGSAPTALAAPRTIAADLPDIADATWVDASTLAVLGRRSLAAPLRVALVPLNDSSRLLGEVPRGQVVTSFGGERDIAVVTSDNHVLLRSGGTFARQFDSRELALPGR